MNESVTSAARPSALGSFVKGAGSGAFSGAVMMGIMALVTMPFGGGFALGTAALTVTATALFGGVMSLKRAVFDAPKASAITAARASHAPEYVAVPDISAPALASTVAMDGAEQPAKNWVASTGRSEGAQSSIQQILANGSLSDRDRAAAITASREAATAESRGL